MDSDSAVRALVGLRLSIAGPAWLTPNLAGRLFGIDAGDNPQGPYFARLFAIRDAALALGVQGSRDEARRKWLALGLACDVADAVAAVAGGRAGYLSRATVVLGGAAAVGAAALGAVALREGGGPIHPVPVTSPSVATPAV